MIMEKQRGTRGKGVLEPFLAKKRREMAEKLIPDNLRKGRILDIGSGTTPLFLMEAEFKEKYGIDPMAKEIQDKNINIVRADLNIHPALPFQDNFFTVITMLAVFEHIEPNNLIDILNEIKRVLKPGGRFILTTPTPWLNVFLKLMAQLNLVSKEEIKEHKEAYSHKKIGDYLEQSGFLKEKMKFGYFELLLNNWAYADK